MSFFESDPNFSMPQFENRNRAREVKPPSKVEQILNKVLENEQILNLLSNPQVAKAMKAFDGASKEQIDKVGASIGLTIINLSARRGIVKALVKLGLPKDQAKAIRNLVIYTPYVVVLNALAAKKGHAEAFAKLPKKDEKI